MPNVVNLFRRSVRGYFGGWIVLSLALLGLAFVGVSAYLALTLVVVRPVAALIVGLAISLSALIAYRMLLVSKQQAPTEPKAGQDEPLTSQGALEAFARQQGSRIPAEVERRPEIAVAVALGAGLVIGFSPRARSLLGSALRQGLQALEDQSEAKR